VLTTGSSGSAIKQIIILISVSIVVHVDSSLTRRRTMRIAAWSSAEHEICWQKRLFVRSQINSESPPIRFLHSKSLLPLHAILAAIAGPALEP